MRLYGIATARSGTWVMICKVLIRANILFIEAPSTTESTILITIPVERDPLTKVNAF